MPTNWTPSPELDTSGCDWDGSGSTTAKPTTAGGATTTANMEATGVELCTDENEGRCECATAEGFQTYTFYVGEVQRCFTVFHPPSRASEALPVVLSPNCYAEDKLTGIDAINKNTPGNTAATRFGYARIGLSSPEGLWNFGNDGIVSNGNPMPCSAEDSKDLAYMHVIFDFIDANPDKFDTSKIYAVGFSQNSAFSATIGFCFNERVLGIWQGGTGLGVKDELPVLLECRTVVAFSARVECKNSQPSISKCDDCAAEYPCEDCQYWPIYPCYSSIRPMVDCLSVYSNDGIAVQMDEDNITPTDPYTENSAVHMYDKLIAEGHDARFLMFSPDAAGGIDGEHSDPKNLAYWHVGCLGITEPCSQTCEDAFLVCVANENPVTALDNVNAFETCIEANVFNGLDGCHEECAPTFNMMAASETPETFNNNFGAGPDSADAKPSTSICNAQ